MHYGLIILYTIKKSQIHRKKLNDNYIYVEIIIIPIILIGLIFVFDFIFEWLIEQYLAV